MKKKIKDLTFEEFETICNKNLNLDNDCKNCPFKDLHSCISIRTYLAVKEENYLNKEIEVDLDE